MTPLFRTVRNIWEKNWPEVDAAVKGGLPQFVLARRPRELGSSVPVFCYHVVNADDFEQDLDFLSRNGYTPINADALLDHLEGRRTAPKRAVVLTIDDGARNLYEVAFPLLKRHGMTGVAFLAPRFHSDLPSDSPAESPPDALRPLTWTEIREMHSSGVIDVQSHTYEHRYVPRWPEPIVLAGWRPEAVRSLLGSALTTAADFRLSREILEEKLGKTVRHLAFPKYNGTSEALRIGSECGYEAFWWGVRSRRPDNRPGESPSFIVRLNGEFMRRLPGEGRRSIREIFRMRFGGSASRLWSRRGLRV